MSLLRSITFKLLISFLIISVLSVMLIVLSARGLTENEFRNYLFNQNRNNILASLSNFYAHNQSWTGVSEALLAPGQVPAPRDIQPGGSFFTLVDANDRVVLAGIGDHIGDILPQTDVAKGLPVKVNGVTVGVMVTRQPVIRTNPADAAFINRVRQIFMISAAGVIALGVLLALLLSRTLTRPIRDLITATRAISAGNQAYEVPIRSHDELGELATSFNRMNAELAHSTELRRQMTADVAHELRTPVSVILGHAEAVHDGVLAPSLETFEIIRDEAGRLNKLIEDLRTLSRADAGELPIVFQRISPSQLLEDVCATHRHRAEQKQIDLQVQLFPDLPEVSADPDRMIQVLNNLVENALSYTPEGGIVLLSARVAGDTLEIRVKDSGPGISEDELERVFERFYRSDPSRHHNDNGSGLGLAIARSIVEKHNGRIWAESKLGAGTSMVIQLPLRGNEPGATPAA
jgi:signal transduction histidine kinase